MLSLMLCSCSVILLQNHNVSPKNSFTVNLLCMLGGLAVSAVMFYMGRKPTPAPDAEITNAVSAVISAFFTF